jgi:hypothetical protein
MDGSIKAPKLHGMTRLLSGEPGHVDPAQGIVVATYPDGSIDAYVPDPLDVDERGRRRMKLVEGVPPYQQLMVDRASGATATPGRCYIDFA